MAACQNQPNNAAVPAPVMVTVEVTRAVEIPVAVQVTQFATVQVPVEVTREIFVEVTPQLAPIVEEAAVGSAENPIQLIFSPLYGKEVTATRAQSLADVLSAETPYSYELIQPDTYEQTLEAACADDANAILFLSSLEYILAEERCNTQIRFAGLRNGIAWQSGMILVPLDANIEAVEELADLTWGVRGTNELATGLYYQAFFESVGLEFELVSEFETDTNTLLALTEENVDFVTADYLPPILPYNERLWEYGEDDPELWRRTGQGPFRSGIGFIVVIDYVDEGGYQVRDARALVYDVDSSIFNTTEILHLSDPLPNDAISYSAMLPLGIASQLDEALLTYTSSAACAASLCSSDFFNWEGVEAVDDSFYDSIRFIKNTLALDEAQIFAYLNR